MTFTPEQVQQLSAKLDKSAVKTREQSGRSLSYIEGWHVISEANRIFGFDAWTSETVEIRLVAEKPRKIGKQSKDGWGVSYVARVRVQVGDIVREGVGAGHGIDVDLGLAHESAIKEAETDARKRALMTFGNPFGLALYDKTQENVGSAEPAPAKPSISERAAAKAPAPAPATGTSLDMIASTLIRAIDAAKSVFELKEWARDPNNRAAKASLDDDAQARVSAYYADKLKHLDELEMAAA